MGTLLTNASKANGGVNQTVLPESFDDSGRVFIKAVGIFDSGSITVEVDNGGPGGFVPVHTFSVAGAENFYAPEGTLIRVVANNLSEESSISVVSTPV